MERFNEEMDEEAGQANIAEIEIDEKNLLLKKIEEYWYSPETVFSAKEVKALAILESHENASKEFSDWSDQNERSRCELKKNLEQTIFDKDRAELNGFLNETREVYCRKYIEARKKLPQINKNHKEKTILDPDINQESKDSIERSLSGIENETIVREILESAGLEARIANSKLDIVNKIDLVCTDGKMLIVVQVKGRFCKDPKNFNGKIFEQLRSSDSPDHDVKKYLKGCENFERELKSSGREMELIKIWINIPSCYKSREYGKYDERLEQDIKKGLNNTLKIQ